ncbi:MAG: DUF4384 domain-containing protein [Spirochaetales bacterium]|nr:DUF4384 domain-containing protein [Spirochaetales bacterium]
MKNTQSHISDLKLERYILGELTGEEKNEINILIKSDAALAARYQAILSSNNEILTLYPPEGLGLNIQWKYNREVEQNRKRKRMFTMRSLSFAGAFLSIFILLFVLIPSEKFPFPILQQNEIVRPKGEMSIKIFRKTQDGAELLSSGTTVKSNSSFQIKYFAANQKYGIIFSIDGSGYVTLHFPTSRNGSLLLDNGKEVALPESFRLDEAPGFERFFFVASKESFELNDVLEAGYQLAENPGKAKTHDLDLSKGFNQESFILLKEGL